MKKFLTLSLALLSIQAFAGFSTSGKGFSQDFIGSYDLIEGASESYGPNGCRDSIDITIVDKKMHFNRGHGFEFFNGCEADEEEKLCIKSSSHSYEYQLKRSDDSGFKTLDKVKYTLKNNILTYTEKQSLNFILLRGISDKLKCIYKKI